MGKNRDFSKFPNAITVLDNGSVTIGATDSTFNLAASTKLQIQNSLLIGYGTTGTFLTMNLTYNSGWKYISSGFGSLYSQDGGEHLFFTTATGTAGGAATINEKVKITSTGQVCIGTSSSTAKLSVVDNLSTYGVIRIQNNSTSGYSAIEVFDSSSSQVGAMGYANASAAAAAGNMYTYSSGNITFLAGGTTEKMRITSAGRVGIGRSSPGTALSVAGQSEQWQLALSTDTGTGAVIGSPSSNVLAFGDWSGVEKMRITPRGDVGIATTSVNWNYANIQALQIRNGFLYGYSNYEVGIGANAYYATGWKFIEAATATMYFCANRSHEFRNSTTTGTANADITWTTPLRIDSSGYVYKSSQPIISGQIGTTDPAGLVSGLKIPFDEFFVSRGITYNSGTRRFTVPVAGVYRITLNPFFNADYAATRVLVGINTDSPTPAAHKGSTYRQTASYDTGCINSVLTLAASDYIVFFIYQGGLYNAVNDYFTQFSIELIG